MSERASERGERGNEGESERVSEREREGKGGRDVQ